MKRTYGRRADAPPPPSSAAAPAGLSAGHPGPPIDAATRPRAAPFTFTEVRSDSEDDGGGAAARSEARATTTATLRASGRTRALLEEVAYHLVRFKRGVLCW
jgi:hypothetical protein